MQVCLYMAQKEGMLQLLTRLRYVIGSGPIHFSWGWIQGSKGCGPQEVRPGGETKLFEGRVGSVMNGVVKIPRSHGNRKGYLGGKNHRAPFGETATFVGPCSSLGMPLQKAYRGKKRAFRVLHPMRTMEKSGLLSQSWFSEAPCGEGRPGQEGIRLLSSRPWAGDYVKSAYMMYSSGS